MASLPGTTPDNTPAPLPPAAFQFEGNNRRRSTRHRYRYFQRIAPREGNLVPSPERFFPVQCLDLSRGGFCFLLPRPPQFTEIVIALGKSPNLIYAVGKILHVRERMYNGRRQYEVGCSFTHRLPG